MLQRFFRRKQAQQSIFLSYASENRAAAEDIAHALANDGHRVFFDKDSLVPGSNFNDRIRSEIRMSDRFVFLLTKPALEPGRFTLSELQFAKERWPAAKDNVLPVLLDPSLPVHDIPAYLRSVHILHVEGNAPAEVAAAIAQGSTRKFRTPFIGATAAASIGLAAFFYYSHEFGGAKQAHFKLLPPDQVDFRPLKQPTASNLDWLDSDVAVTMVPVQYSNMGNRPVRIHNEKVELRLKDKSYGYKRFNEVEFKPAPCPGDWLCTLKGVGAESLEPGRTLSRQTMFIPDGDAKMNWRQFLATIIDELAEVAEARLVSISEVTGWTNTSEASLDIVCHINLKRLKEQLDAAGYRTSQMPPPRLSPYCSAQK